MNEQDCVVVTVYSYNIHLIILNDLSVFQHVQICVFQLSYFIVFTKTHACMAPGVFSAEFADGSMTLQFHEITTAYY